MPAMPLRVALAGRDRFRSELKPAVPVPGEDSPVGEVYRSLPSGLRRAGETLQGAAESAIAAPLNLYDYTHEAEGRAFPRPAPGATAPLPEPKKGPAPEVVAEVAKRAAEAYRTEGPRPAAKPNLPAFEVPSPDSPGAPVALRRQFQRIRKPSGEWIDYNRDTSSEVARSFGRDNFAPSRAGSRPMLPEAGGAGQEAQVARGPVSPTGGHSETFRRPSTPEAQLDWLRFVDDRERQAAGMEEERAGVEARTETSRATAARARLLTQEPLAPEDMAARAKLGPAAVAAQTEVSRRQMTLNVMNDMATQINDLYTNPAYSKLPAAEKKAAEDRIRQQAELTLGALMRINLSPRGSNTLDALLAANLGDEPKKE